MLVGCHAPCRWHIAGHRDEQPRRISRPSERDHTDLPLIVFIVAGVLGTFAGARLGKRLDAVLLRKVFAVFVIGLAVFLLYDNLPKIL
jgi:hypothetical protein